MSMSVSHLNTLGGKHDKSQKRVENQPLHFGVENFCQKIGLGKLVFNTLWWVYRILLTCILVFLHSFLAFLSPLLKGQSKKKSPIFCSFSITDTHELTLCKVHCMFPITFTVFENFLYFHLRPLNDFSLGQNYLKNSPLSRISVHEN